MLSRLAIGILFVIAAAAAAPQPPDVHGWYGTPPEPQVLVTAGADGGLRLLDFEGARFHGLETANGSYRLTGGGGWKGATVRFVEREKGPPTDLRLELPAGPALVLPRARAYPFDVEQVRFPSGSVHLAGVLLVPASAKLGATPAAVVLHGSGSSDRDNVWAYTFAQSLARAGVLTLFADKRGSGGSGGDWRDTGLEGLADDALAGVRLLRGDPRTDRRRIGLVGLSQGGLVAALAAARSDAVAFVVSVSAAPLPLGEQMHHELRQDLERAGTGDAGIEQALRTGELAMTYARQRTDRAWTAFRAAVAELEKGPLAKVAGAFPSERDDWHWDWWRRVVDVDPLPAWKAFRGPRLAVFGEDDEDDNVPVRRSVERLSDVFRTGPGAPDAIHLHPDRGHTLVDPGRGWVDREVLAAIATWVLGTAARR